MRSEFLVYGILALLITALWSAFLRFCGLSWNIVVIAALFIYVLVMIALSSTWVAGAQK